MPASEQYRDDDGLVRLRLVRPYMGPLVSVCLILFVLAALGIAFVGRPYENELLTMAVATPAAVGALLRLYLTWSRSLLIDGTRIGYSNGITKPKGWMETSEVVCVAHRAIGNPAFRPQWGIVLFAPSGGRSALLDRATRYAIDRDDRPALASQEEQHGRLHAFFVPISELGRARTEAIGQFLGDHLAPHLADRVSYVLALRR